ncbi:response regulator [bacterium]|nr:response regulator [bacterium]
MGFKVLVAASGKEGIDIVKEESVDLVLTDYLMPGKNGLEVLKESKQLNPLIEVILITAHVAAQWKRLSISLAEGE